MKVAELFESERSFLELAKDAFKGAVKKFTDAGFPAKFKNEMPFNKDVFGITINVPHEKELEDLAKLMDTVRKEITNVIQHAHDISDAHKTSSGSVEYELDDGYRWSINGGIGGDTATFFLMNNGSEDTPLKKMVDSDSELSKSLAKKEDARRAKAKTQKRWLNDESKK